MEKKAQEYKNPITTWVEGEPDDMVPREYITWTFIPNQMVLVDGRIEYVQ